MFSQINSLDLNSRAVRDAAAKLLSTSKDEVCKVIVDLAAQAATYLNESTELSRGEDQVAQSGNLTTRLIRLATVLVSDRKRKFPVEFTGRGTIPFNMFILIALIFEGNPVVAKPVDESSSCEHRAKVRPSETWR